MAFECELYSIRGEVYNRREEREVSFVDPIPYSRLFVVEKIKSLLKEGKNVLIVGEKGSGKSFLIRKLSNEVIPFPTLKRILKKVSEGKTIGELVENLEGGVIFIDDIDYLSKRNFRILEEVSKKVQIVATSRRELRKDIFKIVKLKPLSNFESFSMAKRYLKNKDKNTWIKIANKSMGNIGNIIKLCKDPKEKVFVRKVDIFPLKYIPIIAFFLLILKYHSYINNVYQLGYLFGMVGWSFLIIYRILKL